MNNISREIANLNSIIQKLQVSYDQYFSGATNREPQDLIKEAEAIISIYGRGRIENPVLRYRFNGLVARYNSFRNVWERKKRKLDGTGMPHSFSLKSSPKKKESYSYIIPPGSLKEKTVAKIFDHYKALRRSCGESVDNIRYENFKASLNEHVSRIRHKADTQSILVKIDIHQNKARISARPFRR